MENFPVLERRNKLNPPAWQRLVFARCELSGLREREFDDVDRSDRADQADWRVYVEFGLRNPNHYQFMFMTQAPADELDEVDRELKGNPGKDAKCVLEVGGARRLMRGVFAKSCAMQN